MGPQQCKDCGRTLAADEIALHRKLFGLSAASYFCLDCQASYLRVSRQRLENVIAYYHRSGTCVLFAPWDEFT